MPSYTVVFVHGWSVTNLNTYGELPLRLRTEGAAAGINIDVKEIFLGRYISFHDEVRVGDVSRAFLTAVGDQLAALLAAAGRFICITHSTGGPVIRDWWHRYYSSTPAVVCPMSHLIMMAPANYGSALAQLGKGRISRLKSWKEGVEPGQGVLDWLELGSGEAWHLNKEWILSNGTQIGPNGIFPFVLTGQSIDRAWYDNLNPYTGELGSDGVVRAAAANLRGRYIRLVQPVPVAAANGKLTATPLAVDDFREGPRTALRILAGKSHSGEDMGIIRSVRKRAGNDKSSETVKAIFDCIRVTTTAAYDNLCNQFDQETTAVQNLELVEEVDRILLLRDRLFIHDLFSMVIFRVVDAEGYPVKDYDLLLTGENNDPNRLPSGFLADRQRNKVNGETITYYFNFNVMKGMNAVPHKGKEIRPTLDGLPVLGLSIFPRPDDGFMRYLPGHIDATADMLQRALAPNTTTMVEIVLQRVVSKEVFRLDKLTDGDMPTKAGGDFKKTKPGSEFVK